MEQQVKWNDLPPTRTNYTEDEIIEAIVQANGLIMVAARNLHLTKDAIYKRAKNSQRVRDAIRLAREELIDLAESALRLSILKGEPWAVSLALKTIGKERGYVERVENSGLDGQAIIHRVTLELPKNGRDEFENQEPPKELEDGNSITT